MIRRALLSLFGKGAADRACDAANYQVALDLGEPGHILCALEEARNPYPRSRIVDTLNRLHLQGLEDDLRVAAQEARTTDTRKLLTAAADLVREALDSAAGAVGVNP